MKISADFTVIPDAFAKAAPPENCIDSTPIVSFPFYIDELDPSVQFLHWEFVDPDSIPVCGFQWNHWSLANLPVDALMYDFNDSHALAIPADFSRTVSAMIPETVHLFDSIGFIAHFFYKLFVFDGRKVDFYIQ